MKQLKLMLLVLAALVLIGAVSAIAIPVSIEEVSVDGTSLAENDYTRLNVERGKEMSISIKILGLADAKNVQIEAFLSGYEYFDFQPVSASTKVFDVEEGVVYVKKLSIRLPENVDRDNYKLRVIVSDRFSEPCVANYNLQIDAPRRYIVVRDVVFTPANEVYAGEYLIASVRLKNYGNKDEEGIKITVSIPKLGVSATDYVDKLESGDSITSEELYLRIPRCNVEPGKYDVAVEVKYDEGYKTSPSFTKSINIASSGPCAPAAEEPLSKLVVSIEGMPKQLTAGGQGAVYPITLSNTGKDSRSVVMVLPQIAWGTLKVSPSNVITLAGGETKTVYVYATASKDATAGDYQFSVALKTVDGKSIQDLSFTASVARAPVSGVGVEFTKGLEIALIVLIIILVIIGLILGFRRLRKGSEEQEEVSGETYY